MAASDPCSFKIVGRMSRPDALKTQTAQTPKACAAVITLHIHYITELRVIGTFFRKYISQRINDINQKLRRKGLDKNPAISKETDLDDLSTELNVKPMATKDPVLCLRGDSRPRLSIGPKTRLPAPTSAQTIRRGRRFLDGRGCRRRG